MSEPQTGRCLCGAVRFRLAKPVHDVGVCHCHMCRRWHGGPGPALECGEAVAFEGEEHIARYKSSEWAERGFCRVCGSSLFYRLVDSGDYFIFAGALDDQTGLNFKTQIFIEEKPDWYDFANETKTMTGEEVFALYAPPPEAKP